MDGGMFLQRLRARVEKADCFIVGILIV